MATVGGLLLIALFGAGCEKKEGLRITGIEPNTGPSTGGSLVTVHGSGFQAKGATGVTIYFGEKESIRKHIEGDEMIKVEPPPGQPGTTVDVMFQFDDSRSLRLPKAYTYQDFSQNNARDSLLKTEEEKANEKAPAP